MTKSKLIGSTMILVGTTIGAGMLAIPMASFEAGFFWASILMILFWAVATMSGLLVIEANLALPKHACSFSSMTERTLGIFGKTITWASCLFLLYAIITAYISGETDLMAKAFSSTLNLNVPGWIIAVTFTSVLGVAVFWSTKTVDHFNRCFLSVKGFLLIATLVLITPHVDFVRIATSQTIAQSKYLCLTVPMLLCAFGYHFVIPSIRIYIGEKPKELKTIVITGGLIALVIYIWWLAAVLGVVPSDNSAKSSVGGLTQLMISLINNKWITTFINSFTNIAMTTSFLGVALSLFDFLADGFKRSDSRFGRLQTALLTFIPPLIFALLYPSGFKAALIYASIPMAILSLILPPLMVYKLRKSKELKSTYRTSFGNITLFSLIALGLVAIALAMMNNLGLLSGL